MAVDDGKMMNIKLALRHSFTFWNSIDTLILHTKIIILKVTLHCTDFNVHGTLILEKGDRLDTVITDTHANGVFNINNSAF